MLCGLDSCLRRNDEGGRNDEKVPVLYCESHQSIVNYQKIKNPGGDLLSHTVTSAVPSAQRGLTAVFGMGTGVTPSL